MINSRLRKGSCCARSARRSTRPCRRFWRPRRPSRDRTTERKNRVGYGRRQRHRASVRSRARKRRRDGGRVGRSEERRVGKEGRSRWSPYHEKKKKKLRG